MAWSTLIDDATLARHLGDPDWVAVDCRFDLADPDAGAAAYAAGHIPGAVYAHLDKVLSRRPGPAEGRHPLPEPEDLARWLGEAGIGSGTQVVAYDGAHGAFAARLWWLLRWLGHERVAVLDGGWAAWTAAGRPMDRDTPCRPPRGFRAHPGCLPTVGAGALCEPGAHAIVDARAAARFRGEHEPVDPLAGHIPGAYNRPFTDNLDDSGRFKSATRLRRDWRPLLARAGTRPLAVMCGSGVTACHHLLALAHAGESGAALYPGSWSEWIRDPRRPVATGD